MEHKPKWKRAERFERKETFELKAKAADIFPLLCPVLEYDWIPDWRCVMVYSESGVAEKDAVFLTQEAPGVTAAWYCTGFDSPVRIEYLVSLGGGSFMKLSARLEERGDGSTLVHWAMLFTVRPPAAGIAKRRFSAARFKAFIALRKKQLEEYFARRA